jgi:hypothetical protein
MDRLFCFLHEAAATKRGLDGLFYCGQPVVGHDHDPLLPLAIHEP